MGFAPGQTVSPDDEGIAPRAVRDIFSRIKAITDARVEMSVLEIYMDKLYDLLNAAPQKNVRCCLDEKNLATHLTWHTVQTLNDVATKMMEATKNRITKRTAMNSSSSRSHAICTLRVSTKTIQAKLTLIDLAGNEQSKRSDTKGDALEEAKSINKGLSALGNVMREFYEKSDYISLSSNILTRVLTDCLTGIQIFSFLLFRYSLNHFSS